MLSSAIFPLKLRIVISYPFPDVSHFCVACVCNDYHQNNQRRHLKMGLASHISDAYDDFSSSYFYFSLHLSPMTMSPTNQMMTVQVPGSLLVCAFLQNMKKRTNRK